MNMQIVYSGLFLLKLLSVDHVYSLRFQSLLGLEKYTLKESTKNHLERNITYLVAEITFKCKVVQKNCY